MGIDFRRPRHIRGFGLGEVLIFGPGIGRVLVEKTASGAIASFSDGADDVPVKSCVVTFTPSGGGGTPSSPVPITGYTGLTIYQTGKNLLDITDVYDQGYFNTSGSWSYSNLYNCYSINCKPNTTYTVSGNFAGILTYWKADGTFISGVNQGSGFSKTFTTPADCYIFRRSILKTNIDGTQMIEVGSSPTTYEAYKTKTPIVDTFGQTIYGGERDLTTNKVKPWHTDTLPSTGWTYTDMFGRSIFLCDFVDAKASTVLEQGNAVCEAYNYQHTQVMASINNKCFVFFSGRILMRDDSYTDATAFGQAVGGLEIAYIPATSTEITGLTSHDISTMHGDNNFWADSGDTEVTYYAYAD